MKKPDLIIKPPEDTEGYYAHNQNCTWVIVAPLTSVIQLTFSAMDIEHYEDCFYDYVAIYDGVRNKEVGRFCGNVIPPPITSSGNILKINFVSDESLAMQGFSFTYSFHDAKSRKCNRRRIVAKFHLNICSLRRKLLNAVWHHKIAQLP